MKCLERNKTEFYYALFVDDEPGKDEYGNESGEPRIIYSEPVLAKANISPATGVSQVEQFGKDEYGNESGEPRIIYSEPVLAKANISPATGVSQVEQFGKDLKYDKVIVLDDTNCPIDENTVLFVDKLPARDEDGNLLFDYIVKKIAKSLNSVSIAISKVDVS